MIENSLFTLLSADAGVAAAFGTPPRIYTDMAPEPATFPLATYFRVDSNPIAGVRQDTKWTRTRVQFTVYGQYRADVRAAADTIKAALARIRQTVGVHAIDDCILLQERDSYAADPHPVGYSAVELDFEIYYQEP